MEGKEGTCHMPRVQQIVPTAGTETRKHLRSVGETKKQSSHVPPHLLLCLYNMLFFLSSFFGSLQL